jgi:hypothetical protein
VDRRLHWITTLAVVLSAIIWMMANQWMLFLPDFSTNSQFFERLLAQSELFWLLVPFLILGVGLLLGEKITRPILIVVTWAILAAVGGQPEVLLVITLFLVGFVVDWAIEKIVQNQLVSLSRRQLNLAAILIVVAVFGWAQMSSLRRQFDQRQISHRDLEAQIAAWLADETPTSASILSSERIGHLAQRSTANWPELNQGLRAGMELERLQETIVDYVVTYNDLSGNSMVEMVWFRLSYEPVKQISSEYDTLAPATIWKFRQPLNNDGQRQTINARVPDRMHILGYQIWPEQLRPGDPVEVALYLQAPQSTFVNQEPFTAIVRLASPDGITYHEWTMSLPERIKPDTWQPNEVIVEQLPLTLPENVPAGEYSFHISLSSPDSTELWPISANNDVNPVDRIRIGQIMVEGS